MNEDTRIVIIDDLPYVALDLCLKLKALGYPAEENGIWVAPTADKGLEAVRKFHPDVVLQDIKLVEEDDDNSTGVDVANVIRLLYDVPVIFITAYPGKIDLAKEAGAYGFLIRDVPSQELDVTIKLALYNHQMQEERASRLVFALDTNGVLQSFNSVAERVTGFKQEELRKPWLVPLVSPKCQQQFRRLLKEEITPGTRKNEVLCVNTKHRADLWLEFDVQGVFLSGKLIGTHCRAHDVTLRREMEERLRQSYKMNVVARLAAGVAHDIKNFEATENGLAELLLKELPKRSRFKEHARLILEASRKSILLAKRLAMIGRAKTGRTTKIRIGTVVKKHERLLRALFCGRRNKLKLCLAENEGWICANRSVIEQLLMNLATNAVDAMPDEGTLTIKTENVETGESQKVVEPCTLSWMQIKKGPHVVLTVEDTGKGMTEDVMSHLFEPYFTTKGKRKGTGLGLAIVYSAVEQCNGHIEVASAVGRGTQFKIFVPRIQTGPQKE